MARSKKAPPADPGPVFPVTIETYRDPMHDLRDIRQTEPSAWNGDIRIRRYRITVELIDEPVEVLRDRLRALWRQTEPNHHRWGPMRAEAKRLGMDPAELKYEDQGADHPWSKR